MDSPAKTKKTHFSISTFKKTKTLNPVIQIEEDQKEIKQSKFKRSYSYIIPKKFVPKLRPHKTTINPTYFLLNEDNDKIEKVRIDENTETKSVNDILSNEDDISFSSLSDVNLDIDEEKITDNLTELIEVDSNEGKLKLDFKMNNEEENKKGKNNSFSSLNNIRKKLHQIKNNSCLKKANECIDLNLINLKRKFSLDEYYFNHNDINVRYIKNENNYNEYKSSLLFCEHKFKIKSKPFLIFDVLTQASQRNKL